MAKKSPSQVAAVVSAVWVMLSIVTDLVRFMKEIGCNIQQIGESFYSLAQAEGQESLKQIAQIIAEAGNKVLSLAEMIALGKYDWVNSDINAENFPVDPTARWDEATRLFHFDKMMSTNAVKAEMDKEGWKPASIWHLLFFGMNNPELQRQFPIIALGSVWRGGVPCLSRDACLRDMDLDGIDNDWRGFCRFLAVRK